ncbi:D-beta-hydroxybutyrate dehydrogenase, mitochondrial [Agrilus planipennis]|uniref:D-beta-hydroxybutyrate dehydrogenase, mitochondrial n=1 Tax=Agrilus planipennis TaxID=224129 RepID=A0A7F5RCY2_AGRPL|nr:D-beta-hydroxybutyrate dehydrogenase, mitochondrial [Agrilus planipennis]
MGNVFSSAGHCILEMFIAVSSGAVGVGYLLVKGFQNNFFRNVFAASLTTTCLIYVFYNDELDKPTKDKVVFITGCDSGLGFSIAQHLCEEGFTVIAGLLNLNSDGAIELRKIFGNKIRYVHLDLTDISSINVAVDSTVQYLDENKDYKLWALINNSGVMVFAEFEWQTERLIRQQVEVNLLGTLNLTRAFCPLLRRYKGRVITVTSHCAQACLPGLSVYGATKAALSSWNDGIRLELKKYGVKVINFIPGSFIAQSNIMMSHQNNCNEMYQNLTQEQQMFYKNYFVKYNSYLNQLSKPKSPKKIDDFGLYEELEKAILHVSPKAKYINEPLNYKLYHLLFKWSPTSYIRDLFIVRFMQVPAFEKSDKNIK